MVAAAEATLCIQSLLLTGVHLWILRGEIRECVPQRGLTTGAGTHTHTHTHTTLSRSCATCAEGRYAFDYTFYMKTNSI